MSIKIEFQDSQRKLFVEFCISRDQMLSKQIEELEAERSAIRKTIKDLADSADSSSNNIQATTPVTGNSPEGYNKNWTLAQRVQFVMRKLSKPVGTGELVDTIIKDYEPQLERRKAVAAISGVLTGKEGRSRFARSLDDRNQTVYTLIDNW